MAKLTMKMLNRELEAQRAVADKLDVDRDYPISIPQYTQGVRANFPDLTEEQVKSVIRMAVKQSHDRARDKFYELREIIDRGEI